jgi:hypothetical protein
MALMFSGRLSTTTFWIQSPKPVENETATSQIGDPTRAGLLPRFVPA